MIGSVDDVSDDEAKVVDMCMLAVVVKTGAEDAYACIRAEVQVV